MHHVYKIFPGIGIARIGTSDEYYIGPEAPGTIYEGPFKHNGKIKKQAARFRIYEYEIDANGNETLIREVRDDATHKIQWHVHLCNKKAASRKIPGVRSALRNPEYIQSKLILDAQDNITGANHVQSNMVGHIDFIHKANNQSAGAASVVLGHLQTDTAGRLLVIGGDGNSAAAVPNSSVESFANNSGWYDDCCDGPVTAKVSVDGQMYDAVPAWVVVASPAYAPAIDNPTTWYDQMRSVDMQYFNPLLSVAPVLFTRDIYPILKRTVHLQWVSANSRAGHSNGSRGDFLSPAKLAQLASNTTENKAARDQVFSRLMPPNSAAPRPNARPTGLQNMPLLYSGLNPQDPTKYNYASLTDLQYEHMSRWANGDFVADWNGEPDMPDFDNIPLAQQPDALNQAALTACIGGPFYPGIETTYLMAREDTYEAPFRISRQHPPGYMTEQMALPWQADFNACGTLWWPAQRPTSVQLANSSIVEWSKGVKEGNHIEMVNKWNELGFVVEDPAGNAFINTEYDNI